MTSFRIVAHGTRYRGKVNGQWLRDAAGRIRSFVDGFQADTAMRDAAARNDTYAGMIGHPCEEDHEARTIARGLTRRQAAKLARAQLEGGHPETLMRRIGFWNLVKFYAKRS